MSINLKVLYFKEIHIQKYAQYFQLTTEHKIQSIYWSNTLRKIIQINEAHVLEMYLQITHLVTTLLLKYRLGLRLRCLKAINKIKMKDQLCKYFGIKQS